METVLGCVLAAGLVSGLVSLWLLPIAASLLLAVPLSALSAWKVAAHAPKAMASPYTLREPAIVRRARVARAEVKSQLMQNVPAE